MSLVRSPEVSEALDYARFCHATLLIDLVQERLPRTETANKLLAFYGCLRQYQSGDNTTEQPSFMAAEKRLKWNAWLKQKGMSKAEARAKAFSIYRSLVTQYSTVFDGLPSDLDTAPFIVALERAIDAGSRNEKTMDTMSEFVSEEQKSFSPRIQESELCQASLPPSQQDTVTAIVNSVRKQKKECEARETAWQSQLRELMDCNSKLRSELEKKNDFYQTMRFLSLIYDVKRRMGNRLFYIVVLAALTVCLIKLRSRRR